MNVFNCAVSSGVYRLGVYVPAFMHSPQVDTGKGGATLVSFAGVRQAPKRQALHADLGNPVSGLAFHGHVMTIKTYVPHAACGHKMKKSSRNKYSTTINPFMHFYTNYFIMSKNLGIISPHNSKLCIKIYYNIIHIIYQ